ncbi:putative LRR receptor-like serine/threonine-protein kinase [Cucumis melo var. makuwa]|uniref:LRR receptor-like serine/threonine-protein kinase n=1 Tax=Cucumis melo var. makuwa TaxID=1194695 RepID=A0A5D3BN03_CUCMM|nr:putative LRR receptor-like serine/threonine-protein kinase [Cucumis melo var. makuwa]TYK01143.1 putative LRR receptor-like serine/threonine-protein kinase [Cucumis melo var. makuwa]
MMMGDLQVIGGIEKLNTQNYKTWSTCMKSYLQGQDLWDVVGGTKVNPSEDVAALKKWNIKAAGNFVVFGSDDVKVYHNLKVSDTPLMQG